MVISTVLFELVEDRKLKMEIFNNKTPEEIEDFSENALIYER